MENATFQRVIIIAKPLRTRTRHCPEPGGIKQKFTEEKTARGLREFSTN
jgi:hypothetical protein